MNSSVSTNVTKNGMRTNPPQKPNITAPELPLSPKIKINTHVTVTDTTSVFILLAFLKQMHDGVVNKM